MRAYVRLSKNSGIRLGPIGLFLLLPLLIVWWLTYGVLVGFWWLCLKGPYWILVGWWVALIRSLAGRAERRPQARRVAT